MRFDFELQICIIRSQKRITQLMQSTICKMQPTIFRFENRMTQVVGFWPNFQRLGSSNFQIEKRHAL